MRRARRRGRMRAAAARPRMMPRPGTGRARGSRNHGTRPRSGSFPGSGHGTTRCAPGSCGGSRRGRTSQTVRKPQRDSPCQPVLFKLGFSSCDQPHTYGTHAQVRPPSPPTQPYIHISVQVNIPSRRVSTFFLPPPPLSPPAVSAAPMTFPPSSVFAGAGEDH